MLAVEYTELGRDTIDGIEVEGIETTDPAYYSGMIDKHCCRLWVDIETQLPVRLEMEMQPALTGKSTISVVMDKFEWGVKFEPGFFEPEIPDDYTF